MQKTYKVKNVSAEDFVEPYTKIAIKAGETVELEQLQAQRVISVFPYRAKLIVDGKTIGEKAKEKESVAIKPEPKEEVANTPKIYKIENISKEDITLTKTGRTIKSGEISPEIPQLEAQAFLSYFVGKTKLIVEAIPEKAAETVAKSKAK